MSKEEQIRDFLGKVPTALILSEAGKRMSLQRTNPGRHKVMGPCRFCGLMFGKRELRLHVAEAHPGGVRTGHKPIPKPPKATKCNYCEEWHGRRALVEHKREKHPEQCYTGRRRKLVEKEEPCTSEQSS